VGGWVVVRGGSWRGGGWVGGLIRPGIIRTLRRLVGTDRGPYAPRGPREPVPVLGRVDLPPFPAAAGGGPFLCFFASFFAYDANSTVFLAVRVSLRFGRRLPDLSPAPASASAAPSAPSSFAKFAASSSTSFQAGSSRHFCFKFAEFADTSSTSESLGAERLASHPSSGIESRIKVGHSEFRSGSKIDLKS